MRLLWARVGVPYSPATGLPIDSQTVSQMVDKLTALPDGTRLYLLAPVVRGRKGEYRKEIADWQRAGFQRLKIDGVSTRSRTRRRSTRSSSTTSTWWWTAWSSSRGSSSALCRQPGAGPAPRRRHRGRRVGRRGRGPRSPSALFSEKFACPVSGFTIAEIEPRLFSFNNPVGACPACDGLGSKLSFDPDLVVPDKDKACTRARSRRGRAAPPRSTPRRCRRWPATTASRWTSRGANLPDRPARSCCTAPGREGEVHLRRQARKYEVYKPFEGVLPNLERRWRETDSAWVREELGRYQSESPCEACHGARLKPEALAVKIDARSIAEVSRWRSATPATGSPRSRTR